MIGIDRYGIRHAQLAGSQRNAVAEEKAGAAAQTPPVLLSGGSETGAAAKSKLSAAFWAIQSAGKGSNDGTDTPEAEFTKLSKMTLAERIRAQILEKHHLTESDFKSLSEGDRKAIEAEIRQAILDAYGVGGSREGSTTSASTGDAPATQPSGSDQKSPTVA